MTGSFFQVVLRTSDVEAAGTFYRALLGPQSLQVVQLHEQAVARGARPHWLGFLTVPDLDQALASFTARGATPLGSKWLNPEGLEALTLRDPGGAIVALANPSEQARNTALTSGPDLAWYNLNTNDVQAAKRNYGELLGWSFGTPLELGELGVLHPFAWQPGGPEVGVMSDIEGRPAVHPHWLFHFRVDALEPALHTLRGAGGTALDTIRLPDGAQITVCEDPQGAAFVLRQGPASVGPAPQ